MGAGTMRQLAVALLVLVAGATGCAGQLRRDYYAGVCPNVESIVRGVVTSKFQQTFATVGATVRLFLHDCFVTGCDASVIIALTANNTAEKDHPINRSLAGDGFDTVIKAKAAVDAVPECRNRVSCADILAMATRDAIALAGGPSHAVELGQLDGLNSTASSVDGMFPSPFFNLDQLTQLFAANGLSQTDMIALSAGHSVGLAHCKHLWPQRAEPGPNDEPRLRGPATGVMSVGFGPVVLDPVTPQAIDNQFFKNLRSGMGLLGSDQVLYSDRRSRPAVEAWADDNVGFNRAFVDAMTKMGRIGLKTGSDGNIRRDCAVLD